MTLHPEIQGFLDALAGAGMPPFSALDPVTAREIIKAARMEIPRVPIDTVETLQVAGADGMLDARLYRSHTDRQAAAIVFYHGGGWVICDLDTHDNFCRALAQRTGAVVISVDYRLAPECKFPGPMEDCYAAKEWVAAHAGSLGIDAARIAVGGDSAGGNLAAAVALATRDRGGAALCHQLLIYPITDRNFDSQSYTDFATDHYLTREDMKWFWDHYLGADDDAKNAYAAPLQAADFGNLPSATIVAARCDPLYSEGHAFANKLRDAGGKVSYRSFDGMIHGFATMVGILNAAEQAVDYIEEMMIPALASH